MRKKNFIYKALLVCLFVCVGQNASAYDSYDFVMDSIYYRKVDETHVKVTYYRSTSTSVVNKGNSFYVGDIVIPSSVTYGGTEYTVNAIGDDAFKYCSSLTSITIPESVTSIGDDAFEYCSSVTSITIPESVTSIGDYAFYGCDCLASIIVPSSVTSMGNYVFSSCDSLIYICLRSSQLKSSCTFDNTCVIYAHDEVYDKLKATNAQRGYLANDSVGYTYESTLSSVNVKFRKFYGGGSRGLYTWRITNSDDDFERVSGLQSSELEEFKKDSLLPGKQYVFTNFGFEKYVYASSGGSGGYSRPAPQYFDVYCTTQQPTIEIQSTKATYRTLTCCVFASSIDDNNPSEVGVELNGKRYAKQSVDYDWLMISDLKPAQSLELKPYAIYGDSIYYGESVKCSTNTPVFSYAVADKTQTSIGISGITASTGDEIQCNEAGVLYGDTYYKADDNGYAKVTGLFPNKKYTLNVYANYGDTIVVSKFFSVTTENIEPQFDIATSPTAITFNNIICEVSEDLKITSWAFYFDDEFITDGKRVFTHLEPNNKYSARYIVWVEGNGESGEFDSHEYITTDDIELETLQPKVVSSTCAIAAATTNISEEETNVGFQWKKYDAPESLAPNEGYTAIYDSTLEGYIKNLQATYYNVRAFYKSAAEEYYYGEWVTFDQTDFSYFEPTVHTYDATDVTHNSAKVKGYVMQGTDDVTEQGFEYWKSSSSAANAMVAYAPSATDNVTTVLATGQVMTATLDNLQPSTIYCCRAFVTTASGTVYGEEQTFTTTEDVTGIKGVQTGTAEPAVIGYYDLQGRRLSSKVRGVNIIRYSDGTARKVYVK